MGDVLMHLFSCMGSMMPIDFALLSHTHTYFVLQVRIKEFQPQSYFQVLPFTGYTIVHVHLSLPPTATPGVCNMALHCMIVRPPRTKESFSCTYLRARMSCSRRLSLSQDIKKPSSQDDSSSQRSGGLTPGSCPGDIPCQLLT